MLIQEKKLPKTVEEERKELYNSKKGKELLAGAQKLQNEIQGIANKAMLEAKKKKGTTGMDFDELDNVMDDFEQHTHRPAIGAVSSKTSSQVARYVFRDRKLRCVHDPYKNNRNKLWKPLFSK
ncbi:MAG: hypothetical protein OXH00_03030 [Candidatus Poribacteria bacterium]|nr:hypothetical protein [Candidatus Poribacteria bacterium]